MKIVAFILLAAISSASCQSTFTVGGNPQYQRPYYPAQGAYPVQNGYPVQRGYPVQGGIPMGGAPMGGGIPMGGGGGGVPIGAIIGLVGMLAQTAIAADQQKKMRQQQAQQAYAYNQNENEFFDLNTASGVEIPVSNRSASQAQPVRQASVVPSYQSADGSVYKKVSEQVTPEGVRTVYASGPFDKVIGGIPNGIVLPNGNIKSPYSDYTVDIMENAALKPGHILTDPNCKKNFRIPYMESD